MKKEYQNVGEKRIINGETFYSQGTATDGMEYGYVYKNEQAFYEQPDEICYIPEHAFDDIDFCEMNGEKFYRAEEVDGYTRRQLEELIANEIDEDGEPINIEYFFQSLYWCYPETKLNEIC